LRRKTGNVQGGAFKASRVRCPALAYSQIFDDARFVAAIGDVRYPVPLAVIPQVHILGKSACSRAANLGEPLFDVIFISGLSRP
jgi:hypothetical protein